MTEHWRATLLVFGFIFLIVLTPGQAASAQTPEKLRIDRREDAYRANNLGVAQLEQFDYAAAAEEFRRALAIDPQLELARINLAIALFNAQDIGAALNEAEAAARLAPNSPQPQYLLGLIAKNQNRIGDAVEAFGKVLAVDPNDVGTNVNLGQIYIQQRKYDEAITAFRTAVETEPYNSTAIYNLATALFRRGRREEGQQLMARFQTLRQSGAATSIGQNYLEQGRYAEAIVSTGAESGLVDKTAPDVSFRRADSFPAIRPQRRAPALRPVFEPQKLKSPYQSLDRFTGGAAFIDFDGDGDLDLAKLSVTRNAGTRRFATRISLYRNDGGKFTDVTKIAGDAGKAFDTAATGIVAGDFDNDGSPDLFIIGYGKLTLLRGAGNGKFTDVSAAAKLPAYPYLSVSAAFVDVDHDGDLDIFIPGFADPAVRRANGRFAPASNMLLRNNGQGTFTDISAAANVNSASSKGNSVAVIPTDYDNRRDVDLLVLNYGSAPSLFRNMRGGSFRDIAAEVGLSRVAKWTSVAAGDFNKDSFIDFFFGRADGRGVFAGSDGRGKFVMTDAPPKTENAFSAQFLDYDNDGLLDLVVNTDKGFVVARNLGEGWAPASSTPFEEKADSSDPIAASRQMLAADVDGDGDEDLFAYSGSGALQMLENEGGNKNASQTIRLTGRNSNRTGIGVKIDMRSGSLAQRLETYSASPAPAPADVQFGLGKRERPDAVRLLWPSGVVQAETSFLPSAIFARQIKIEELDRKPSSCPYLYTWNGERFEFITDFLGGGEMGSWAGAGAYNYPDSDEFVRIAPGKLKAKNGRYEIRVTNELEEVLFLDYMRLVAVEHDADTEVYPNEGLGIPTAEKKILYTTRGEQPPLSAVDAAGKNVLPAIEKTDRKFYDSFKPQNIRGYAAEHSLTLNLDNKRGYKGRTLLLLSGWTDYAFSSDNLAASQSGRSLFLPKLQVKNKKGEWQTVIEQIGISIGRPQTVVVDLTGKFLTGSREVRIVTNFKTYWDKIAVDTSEQQDVKTIEIAPSVANLGERGFSKELKFGQMIAADYEKVVNDGRWKYFSGSFTRLGDVKTLIAAVDDVFVISKTGDELVLSFAALPEPPSGKKYTFLLYADGYSKEMDINSGSPDAVLPLPFKQMKKYPYGPDEQFPMTDEKRRIYDQYTTRTRRSTLPRLETTLVNQ